MLRVALPALLMSIASSNASGHELRHTVATAQSIVVSVTYADGSPLALAYYEVRELADDALLQVGQTDGSGRAVFLPREPGRYRVRVFSEDGHGIDIVVPVDQAGRELTSEQPLFERYAKPIAGLGILLGLFGVIALLRCRRPGSSSN